jgi:hypothetical protein
MRFIRKHLFPVNFLNQLQHPILQLFLTKTGFQAIYGSQMAGLYGIKKSDITGYWTSF